MPIVTFLRYGHMRYTTITLSPDYIASTFQDDRCEMSSSALISGEKSGTEKILSAGEEKGDLRMFRFDVNPSFKSTPRPEIECDNERDALEPRTTDGRLTRPRVQQ